MKNVVSLLVALAVVSGGSSVVSAASARCVVVQVEEKQLVLECERGTDGFEPGQEVKIKSERTGGAIEGC